MRTKMSPRESRQLTVGECICWQNDRRDMGTVVDVSWSGIEIVWDNSATPLFYHHNGVQRIMKVDL